MTTQDKLADALRGIVELGKRDLTNPKYDGYFYAAREALAEHDAKTASPDAPALVQVDDARNLFAPGDIVRHRKGDTYRVEGRCVIEATMADCYAYRGKDGRLWIRPVAEMEDGRFARESAHPPAPAADGAGELPPLPPVDGYDKRVVGHYSAASMHAYARAAIAALRQPVPDVVHAAVVRLKDRTFPAHECPAESAAVWNVALYELESALTGSEGEGNV